jgi:hypothetical protein
MTTAHADAVAANPASARSVLSLAEYQAGQGSVAVAKMNFGFKAVERGVGQEFRQFQPHQQLFDIAGGPEQAGLYGRAGEVRPPE